MKICFLLLILIMFTGFSCQQTVTKTSTINSDSTDTVVSNTSRNISVTKPFSNNSVDNPFRVSGQARVFENVVSWRLKDSGGNQIASGTTEAMAPDIGQFGAFDFWVVVPAVDDKNITLEVFQASAKDGSDTDLVSVPLALKRTDSTRLDLYFHNNDLDPEISCTKVFSITKNIITTQSPARAAMIMLLQGSSDSERETNYYSAIPFRSFLKDISLSDDGVATVDLGGAVAGPLGGSCLVGGIAAEIENTLKQFPEVKEVKILIDGKENALQP